MASQSQYWSNQERIYKQSKEKNEKLKEKYEEFLPKLKSLNTCVSTVSSHLTNCKNKFTSGGYVNAGKGLYSDTIDTILSKLSDDAAVLTKSINFCEERINVLVGTIASYDAKRREAHENYIYWRERENNVTIRAA